MTTYLSDLYNNLLVATAEHKVFSLQVMISLCYLLALALSIYRANRNKELFSDFLSIAVVVTKYMLTTLLMEKVLMFVANSGRSDLAQNVYLALSSASVLSMFVLYYLHTRFSYKYGDLFFCVMKLSAVLAIAHFVIWVKFVVLNIQVEHEYLHYMYSFIVLYVSIVLAIAMLFPYILRTRFGCIIGLYLPRGRYD
ncbi:hypothetical protein [Pseudoalteromonas rhizosphaerae]|uniref:hypothetical protein n=1 Tax=Pseudoalteromonas rhizosphaerae TaxID=2518973 RepID=UPI00384A719C